MSSFSTAGDAPHTSMFIRRRALSIPLMLKAAARGRK